jgi:hypothetical protein
MATPPGQIRIASVAKEDTYGKSAQTQFARGNAQSNASF